MVERDELVELAKRMLANVEAGTTDQAAGTYEVPVAAYADPHVWATEMDLLFKRRPLALAGITGASIEKYRIDARGPVVGPDGVPTSQF